MEDLKLNSLIERIKKETIRSRLTPREIGLEDGKNDALEFHHADFIKFELLMEGKYALNQVNKEDIESFRGQVRPNKNSKKLTIRRIEQGEGLEGVYLIDFDAVDPSFFETLSEADRSPYLQGWLQGVASVYKIAKDSL